jgi:adenylate cyclase
MPRRFIAAPFGRGSIPRSPIPGYILRQIFYWIFAYTFLAVLIHLVLLTATPFAFGANNLRANFILALYFGFFNGLASGLADVFFERRFFYKKSLGLIILFKAILSLFVFIVLISFIRYSIYPYLLKRFFPQRNPVTVQQSWDSFFQFLLLYNTVTGLIIHFFNQVNKKFGPGVLVPLLLGKYRKPKEEDKIFLFMDLSSSTTIAEELGHLQYSAFIRDSFMDINAVISRYRGQIYQYVGDEIVIFWPIDEGLKNLSCFRFFFACKEMFQQRSSYYLQRFKQVPHFKAGLHMGKVTAVEVGDIKRDIAYHGDTVNTAARIQGVCSQYGRSFLASGSMVSNSVVQEFYETISLGMIHLKGKAQPVELFSIQPRS